MFSLDILVFPTSGAGSMHTILSFCISDLCGPLAFHLSVHLLNIRIVDVIIVKLLALL